jgi:hypothetical protein
LDEAAGMTRGEVQGVYDPGQFAVSIPSGADLPVARQVSTVLRLAIDLVGDHQCVVAEPGGALVHPLQQVLKDDGVRWVGCVIAGALANYVHGTGNHSDILRGDRLNDVIKDAYPCRIGTPPHAPPAWKISCP